MTLAQTLVRLTPVVLVLLCRDLASEALPHHSFAMFDGQGGDTVSATEGPPAPAVQ